MSRCPIFIVERRAYDEAMSMQRSLWRRFWIGSLAWTQLAAAQTPAAAPAPSPTPPAPTVAPTRATTAGADATKPATVAVQTERDPNDPFVPVDDPMLRPVERAPHNLRDWREALQLVRTRSPDLRVALAQIEVSRGRARMALAGALPKLTGTGTLTHQLVQYEPINPSPVPFPATVFTARADLVVPLLSARNWYDYATAKDTVQKIEVDVDEAERKVIAGLAEAVVAVITAERLAEVTRVSLASALSTLELNRRSERLGASNGIDVLRAEQEVARSRANLIDSDEQVKRSREALGQALGDSVPWGVPPEINLNTLQADARSTCHEESDVERRPDVRSARAAEHIAERNVSSVDYSFVPTVNATSALVYSTNDFSTGSRGPVAWSIGGVLSWNLYDGGFRYGERQQNEGLLEATREQTGAIRRAARIQVGQTRRGVDVARQRLEVARIGNQVAQDSARLARVKFNAGDGTSFDMVDTQRAAREAELDVTVKEFELVRAEIIAFLALASCDI